MHELAPNLVSCFFQNVERCGEKICLYFQHGNEKKTQAFSFSQMSLEASGFASAYKDAGLSSGDVVLIFLDHHPSMFACYLGAIMVGAIPSFMPCPSPKQHPERYWPSHRQLLRRISPKAIVTDSFHAKEMKAFGLLCDPVKFIDIDGVQPARERFDPMHIDPENIAFLQHSSGTTGSKKGVCLSHKAVINQVSSYAGSLGLQPEDNIVSWLPVYHDMGLVACMIMPLVLGLTVVMMEPLRWTVQPVMLFEAIDKYDGRFVWLPNFAFEHLCKTVGGLSPVADLSRVKAFINCSEPCKLETFERFTRTFSGWGVRSSQLQVCYAMAENVFAVTQTPLEREPQGAFPEVLSPLGSEGTMTPTTSSADELIASVGFPIPGVEICIRDDDGNPLPDGKVGEITLKGDCLFKEYFNLADVTAERLQHGYYHTRDLGFRRNGELFVLGRMDDLIIANGKNFYAHDLEAIVNEIEGVKPGRCIVFGLFNASLGSEQVVIVAEAMPELDITETVLRRVIKENIFDKSGLLIKDAHIVNHTWLVKTSSGKLSRDANRAKYLSERSLNGSYGSAGDDQKR